MKWRWVILGLLVALAVAADVVTLTWDASPSGGLRQYRLFYGTNEAWLVYVEDLGLGTTQAVTLPHRGRWFFAVQAVDTNGVVSVLSRVVEFESKPEPPQLKGEVWVRLTPVIERSADLTNWVSVAGVPTWFPATNAQEFFSTRRLLIERVQRVNQP